MTNVEPALDDVVVGIVKAILAQGSAAKWAHAAMALAVRALGRGDSTAAPDPGAVLRMVERVMTEGVARSGASPAACSIGATHSKRSPTVTGPMPPQ